MTQPQIRPIELEVLPNGLQVLLYETHLAPVAEFQIWAKAGSADERDFERGVAHFHEHMLFKGTQRRGVGDVAGEVEGAGGRINAYTSYDVTVYHVTLPSDRLAVGIDVLADIVLHSVFDPEEIRREIEVVLEEIRRGEDSPGSVLGNAVFAEVYQSHPYRSPILGTAESVSSFDRDRVRGFYERWYVPENLVAVVVGDFDRAAVVETLRRAFDAPGRSAPPRRRPPEPLQQRLRNAVLARPFERSNSELAYPSVGLGHPDAALLDLAAYVLGGCESSRLVQSVKEREGLAERIDAYSYTPLDPGVFAVDFETDGDRSLAAVEAAVREVERLRAEPVPDEELEKARVNFLASEHFERESVAGLAAKIGSFHVTGGGVEVEERYLETVRRATPGDLLRVAREYLVPEHLTVGAVAPEADARRLEPDAIRSAVERGAERTRRLFSIPRRLPGRDTVQSYALENGVYLHVIARPGVPVVAARAAFRGGLLAEGATSSGLTAFLASMWLRGTESHSAASFARAVESHAAEIDSFAGRSSFGLTLETPADRLEPALDLFAQVLLEPAFDAEELERERKETLAAIERREDRLAQRAFLLFAENHYLAHPYRMPTLGSAQVVAGLDRDAVCAHEERLVRGPNLHLAVSGEVDPDRIARELSVRLAELPGGPFAAPDPPAEPPPREIRRAELRKDRAQAHLVLGFRGLSVDEDDRFALEVISQLLAGQGGRLFLELRDRGGLAYSVSAVNVEGIAPGYFAVYIATAPEKLESARAGLVRELGEVTRVPPSPSELERARRYLTGNFLIDLQRNAVHAAQASLNSLYGLGPAAHLEYAARIEAVSADDVVRVARRVLDLDAYTEAVIRP